MKHLSIYFCFITIFLGCTNQRKKIEKSDQNIDSVSIYISNAKQENIDKTIQLGLYQKALEKLKIIKNDSINRNSIFQVTQELYRKNFNKEFIEASDLLIEKSIEADDSLNLGQAYRYKGNFYKNLSINDSSFKYYLKAEKIFQKNKDVSSFSSVLLNKSIIQYSIGDYSGSDKSLTEAYKLSKDSNEYEKLYAIFTMMGIVANETKDYSKAIDYYSKALKIVERNNLTSNFQKETCLNNIGYVYQNKGDYFEAIKKYRIALKNSQISSNDMELYSLLIDNLAYSKFKIKDNDNLPQLFFKSLEVRNKINQPTLIILSKIHISEYYHSKKDTFLSQKFSKEALDLAKKNGISRDFLAALKQSSMVDQKNSSKYSKDYIRISDSIQDVEKKSQEKFARLQLETNEIIEENQGLAEKNRNLLYVFVVTFILVVLLFVVRAQRARTRELLYKQAQQKANEDIYNLMMSQQAIIDESRSKEKKRLAQDLHDGVLGRMFGLRLNLDSLNSSTDEEAVQKRFELLNELKTIEQDIREISHDLNREKQVLINNFVSIVHNLLEEQKNAFDAEVNYTIDNTVNWDKIGNAIKINLYRILQEGLQNINKYANAKNISVEIKGDEENVYLKIKDDGVGFDVNRKSKGIGMQNMISRTHDCKGIIDITSKKDEGTKIVITIPIETKQPTTIPQE